MNELLNKITQGDCLEVMRQIPDKSVDMILCDLPYGTTACKWDTILPFEDLWTHYERVIKDNGAIVLTASQPFSSSLVMSNPKLFKYEWIWDKKIPSGMSYARFQPMRQHEVVLVFGKGRLPYNAQMVKRDKPIKSGGTKKSLTAPIAHKDEKFSRTYDYKNPTTLISFDKIRKGSVHPTQKPVALFEYLIKTYTDENEIILDNCIGSGTTAVAAINTNRQFIGIERESEYVEIGNRRITEALRKRE
jgi:site-specific DNA-methyltransferase (adenine-specific)